MEKEETQRKYLEFQSLNEQLKQLQNSLLNLDQQLIELRKLQESLESTKNTKVDEEVLVLLGAGTYIKTKLNDNKKVLMNVGSDKIVNKDINESINLIKSQIDELINVHKNMNEELQNNTLKLQKLHQELQTSVPQS
ncbi:MAG: prefoldin subunit alpha [Candidatus Nanoarchaeia archaeon]|jgi:prefoldin alpha subunit|nr:prefoldin subunit alpha [Candidatus Nanoarchaeia archaeon]|tara:strand:- start:7206 stop:7616 length:411 start_codon:yes stop_codon:yes gene_type:complete